MLHQLLLRMDLRERSLHVSPDPSKSSFATTRWNVQRHLIEEYSCVSTLQYPYV